jgi:WD40 repeat protein/DNA-binding SARP family transcriptional activator/serine/threonine protein kinase
LTATRMLGQCLTANPLREYRFVMKVRVLGALEVVRDGDLVPLGGTKQRTVLALLVQHVDHRVSVDELLLGVYGEGAPDRARRTLQTYVSNLRHQFGDAIRGTRGGYVLTLDRAAIDAQRFEADCRAAMSELAHEPERAADRLRAALALWRGRPYADIEAHGLLDTEVARLDELRLTALERRIQADLALGRHDELLGELGSLVVEHPYRESLRAHHVTALYRAGRQSDALAAVDHTRNLLADELGIDLSPRIQQLERRILMQDPDLELDVGRRVERRAVLVAQLDAESWSAGRRADALSRRDEILNSVVERSEATVMGLRGTAVFAAFAEVSTAAETAVTLAALGTEPTLRVAVDHGDVEVRGDEVTGPPANRVARIVALAHPGQVLLSSDAHRALSVGDVAGWSVTTLGRHVVTGVDEPLALYQLHGHGLPERFPPLRSDRLPPPVPRADPAAVPGYELRTPMATGPFGTVYRAYQASVGREVTVRAIRRDLAADAAFIRRFEAEGQRVARLTHPHVLGLLDYWRDPDGAYLVHPLVVGGDLRRRLSARSSPQDAVSVLEQIAAALSYAHDHGVVHGRLHPGNLLVDETDNLYVADLGLAQMCEGLLTASAHAYAAPETLGGGQVTVAADVYSLGVLAFELLAGRPPPQDGPLPLPDDAVGAVLSTATSPAPAERHGSVAGFLAELRAAQTGVAAGPPRRTAVRNPYRGLAPFLEADARDFHGREDLVDEMIDVLQRHRLLAAVGPSGIGKSSAVRAGLVPALRAGAIPGSQRWLITDLFPGAHPFVELADALRRVAVDSAPEMRSRSTDVEFDLVRAAQRVLPSDSDLLLLVDQFEELFTQTSDEATRRRFLEVLTAAATDPRSRIRVVVTLRADFFDRPLRYASFAEILRRGVVAVRAPDRAELARCVREPAAGVDVAVEDRLVDRIVSDAEEQIGALPLVQHVLAEGFEAREADVLSLADYEGSGGLHGAVGRKAESLYVAFTSQQRTAARELLLRLVTVDEQGEDTRRRVRLTELSHLGFDRSDLDHVLDVLGRNRLVTFDRDPVTRGPTVEFAHEALLSEWDRLRGWIDTVRDELLLRRRIVSAVREWEDSDHDQSFLLRGVRLEAAEQWEQSSELALAEEERRYLAASRVAADADAARSRRRRRRTISLLSTALALTLVLSGVSIVQRGVAEEQADLTRARELAGDAQLAITADPERGVLLALEAVATHRDTQQRPVPDAVSALQAALQASRVELHLPDGNETLALGPEGRLLATGSSEDPTAVRVVDIASGEEVAHFDALAAVGGLAFSPDGSTFAVGYLETDGEPAVSTFEVGSWRQLASFDGPPGSYRRVRFTDDGGRHLAAVAFRVHLIVWDATTGALTATVPGAWDAHPVPASTAFAVTEGAEEVRLVDGRDGTTIETLATPGIAGDSVAVDPDGTNVAVSSFTKRAVEVWDRPSGERVAALANNSPSGDVAFSPDGRVAHTSNDGTIRLAHVEGEADELTLRGHVDGVTSIAFAPDGDTLVSTSWAPETRTWDITPDGPAALNNLWVPDGPIWELAPGVGQRLAVTVNLPGDRQRTDLVDLDRGNRNIAVDGLRRSGHHNAVIAADLTTMAGLDDQFRGHVYDLPTGRHRLALPPCWSPRALSPDGSSLVVDGRMLCTFVEGTPKLLDPTADADLRSAVVDAHTGQVLRDLGERPVNSAALGPADSAADGLAAVSIDWETIELHDVGSDQLVGSLELDGEFSTSMWFSDDGSYLAYGTQSGQVTVIDVATAREQDLTDAVVWRFREPHGGVVSHTRISNGLLATGSMAGRVSVYVLEDRRLLADLAVETLGPVPIAFTADGTALLYPEGRTMRRLELELDRLLALARSRLTRDFTPEECAQYLIERSPCPEAIDA